MALKNRCKKANRKSHIDSRINAMITGSVLAVLNDLNFSKCLKMLLKGGEFHSLLTVSFLISPIVRERPSANRFIPPVLPVRPIVLDY